MKKIVAMLMLTSLWLGASEFVSLTHGQLLDKMNTQGAKGGSYLSFTDKFQMTHSAGRASGNLEYTVPNGWQRFKIYIPAGMKSGGIVMTPSTNVGFRYYFHFKANINNNIDNASTSPYFTSPYAFEGQQTLAGKGTPTSSISLDSYADAINAAGGGWIYFDILEDNFNLGTNYQDTILHPNLTVSWSVILKDDANVDAWVSNTVFIGGDPEDAVSVVYSTDPDGSTQTVQMDRGETHYNSMQDYTNGGGSTVSAGTSSSAAAAYSSASYSSYSNDGTNQCPTGTTYVNGECQVTGATYSSTAYSSYSYSSYSYSSYNNSGSTNANQCPTGTTLVNGECQVSGATYSSTAYSSYSYSSYSYSSSSYNYSGSTNTNQCPTGTTLVDGECQATGGSVTPGNVTEDDREVIRKSVAEEVANQNFTVDGYMVQYRKNSSDPFVWLYISKSTNLVYKLNGLNSDGTFDWIKLENASQSIHSFDNVQIDSDHSTVTFGNTVE